MTDMLDSYVKCLKPDCMRKVKKGVAYCCRACDLADQHGYEVHEDGLLGHSPSCNTRNIDRGECTPTEAVLLSQERK